MLIPGEDGARVRGSITFFKDDHFEVRLSPEDMERIITWLDCNSNFYGAYRYEEEQAQGNVVMPLRGLPPGVPIESLQH